MTPLVAPTVEDRQHRQGQHRPQLRSGRRVRMPRVSAVHAVLHIYGRRGAHPNGSTIKATGDLVGTGIWRLTPRDGGVDVEYLWHVLLEKPLLRLLSPVRRPLLAWNHKWSMDRGAGRIAPRVVAPTKITKRS